MVEFALIFLVLFPLVLAAFDGGFYGYAFIAVQNAARAAALRNSGGLDSAADQTTACSLVVDELQGLPNIGGSFASPCTISPVVVTAQLLCATPSACSGTAATPDGQPGAQVTVAYTMPEVFQIPFVGPGALTISSEMKIRSIQ